MFIEKTPGYITKGRGTTNSRQIWACLHKHKTKQHLSLSSSPIPSSHSPLFSLHTLWQGAWKHGINGYGQGRWVERHSPIFSLSHVPSSSAWQPRSLVKLHGLQQIINTAPSKKESHVVWLQNLLAMVPLTCNSKNPGFIFPLVKGKFW